FSTDTPPLAYEERALELARTERTVYRLTGRSTLPYFRPPFGDLDDSVLADVGREGYAYAVMWTVDTLGWDGLAAPAIVARGLALAEPGAIFIMHVGSASQDAAALPDLVAGLRAAGYGFVPVSELIAAAR
ncbi:MAG TPA: polysaccharide deacetylase family protein, partial [Dehalococcoidia bacterium]|nr:polysaccharide deacetylase family protein [Dehalococcoidia bacterium]